MKPPCKDCPDRYPACSAHCDKYKTWKQKYEECKERERQRVGVYRPPRGGYTNPYFVPHRIKGDQ